MLEFNADEWSVAKGSRKIELTERHYLEVRVSCTKMVTVYGVSGQKKVPLQSGTQFRCRARTTGFTHVEIKGTGQTEFGYTTRQIPIQDGEPLTHEKPAAPPLPSATNLVAQIARTIRQEMRYQRDPVMEPEDHPFATRYEVDDDDFEFEEDIVERTRREKKEARERAKAKKEEAELEQQIKEGEEPRSPTTSARAPEPSGPVQQQEPPLAAE